MKTLLDGFASNVHDGITQRVAQQNYYSSDGYSTYSSSSADMRPPRPGKSAAVDGYFDGEGEEWSDSTDSSGLDGQVEKRGFRENGKFINDKARMAVGGDCRIQSVNFSEDVDSNSLKDKHPSIPSAPPFAGYEKEISHAVGEMALTRLNCVPTTQILGGSYVKGEISDSHSENDASNMHFRSTSSGIQEARKTCSVQARIPKFHASEQGPWHCLLAYDACVRLCLHSWARGCLDAPSFLENECALLRKAFSLQQILLQPEEELLQQQCSGSSGQGVLTKPKKVVGKIKVQVRKVKISPDMPFSCSSSLMNIKSIQFRLSSLCSMLSAEWKSLRQALFFSKHHLACISASAQYAKKVSSPFKVGVTSIQTGALYDLIEAHTCRLKLKSSTEEEKIHLNPGTGETHSFFPDSFGDDLYIEVYDSKGKFCGRVVVQVPTLAEDDNEKTRWWPIYLEPEHSLVGWLQLCSSYMSSSNENNTKYGTIAETVAYDVVLEVAMKAQHFRERNLMLHGSWKWLLTEFATYFGISEAYTKLRYLSYMMDVATPTADCLMLVHDLLLPVIEKGSNKNGLSHQENRILGEVLEQIEEIVALVFENYKSLDEFSLSGLVEDFEPANGNPSPALASAVKLYTLIHDILSPEARLKLCSHFQVAVKKRSRRHIFDTDEIFACSTDGTLLEVGVSIAYQKMKTLCYNISQEIGTDIEIQNHHVLPSFIDLPNISASIYSVELCTRLRSFLRACPPAGPSSPVADLVIATADFQKNLASWNLCPVKGGVDAKELFHLYIVLWIQEKRLALLQSCKVDKVKWSGVRTQHLTTPFVEEVYDQLKETMNEYEVIMCRWPEYISLLENAIADVENATLQTLERRYIEPKRLVFKCMQKLVKGQKPSPYIVPDELGTLMNTMKRMLDVLGPGLEKKLKSWGSCMPDDAPGERLNEVAVTFRSKFRNHLQAVVDKLAENTNLKKILQGSRAVVEESERFIQQLRGQLTETMNHIHGVFEASVFVSVCRCLWNRLGQDVLKSLEKHKENRSWYKASRETIAVLDEIFASQMQHLRGNSLQENDLEPPGSITEVRSFLSKDVHRYSMFNY